MPAAVADRSDPFTGADDVAHLLIEGFVITVETEVAVTVVYDQEVPEAAQPVGENHPRPPATALTSSPPRAAMNSPFQTTPPPCRGLPKRFASSPRTGKVNLPRKRAKGLSSLSRFGMRSFVTPDSLRGLGSGAARARGVRAMRRASCPISLVRRASSRRRFAT